MTDWYRNQDVDDVMVTGLHWIQFKTCWDESEDEGVSFWRVGPSNIVLPRSLTVSSQLPLTFRVSVLVCCSVFILCIIFSCNRVCGFFINSCSFHFLHPVCSLISYFPFDSVFACWQLSCFVSLQPLIIYSLFFKHPSFCPSCSSCVVLVVFAACLFVWYQFTV